MTRLLGHLKPRAESLEEGGPARLGLLPSCGFVGLDHEWVSAIRWPNRQLLGCYITLP